MGVVVGGWVVGGNIPTHHEPHEPQVMNEKILPAEGSGTHASRIK